MTVTVTSSRFVADIRGRQRRHPRAVDVSRGLSSRGDPGALIRDATRVAPTWSRGVRAPPPASGRLSVLLNLAIMSVVSRSPTVADTSWDVSPRNFIVTAAIAAAFWIAFLVSLWRMRARILILPSASRRR